MGAYYAACNTKDKEILKTWKFNTGAKMMEHSYIGNSFIDVVLNEIFEGSWKNKPITWLCDYDESFEFEGLWDNSIEIDSCAENLDWLDYSDCIIINNDTKEYIDLVEYKLNWLGERKWVIHPFSLLTSSVNQAMGGGDYQFDNDNRGRWSNCRFVVTFNRFEAPAHYKNITKDVYFYEEEEQIKLVEDKFKQEVLFAGTKHEDFETIERKVVKISLNENASKSEVINGLISNEKSYLEFNKSNGQRVVRIANIDASKLKDSDSSSSNDRYLWFFDLEENKLKRMVFDNFISLKPIQS